MAKPRRSISARPYAVEKHPKRKEIDRAIVSGQSILSISQEYGISRGALTSYRDRVLYKTIVEFEQRQTMGSQSVVNATKESQVLDANELFDIILSAVTRMRKMSDACDEYLQDPDDVQKYFLGPREEELWVVGYRIDKEGKKRKVKQDLNSILSKLDDNNYKISKLTSKAADPRELLVKASETLSRQMDSMINAWKAIEDQRVSFSKSPEWGLLTEFLQEFLERHPEERLELADRLRSI